MVKPVQEHLRLLGEAWGQQMPALLTSIGVSAPWWETPVPTAALKSLAHQVVSALIDKAPMG